LGLTIDAPLINLLFQRRGILGRVEIGQDSTEHFTRGPSKHAEKNLVGEQNFVAVVVDEYALIERL